MTRILRVFTAIVITCYDRDGKEVKRVTSADDAEVEEGDGENQSTENQGTTGGGNTGSDDDNQGGNTGTITPGGTDEN